MLNLDVPDNLTRYLTEAGLLTPGEGARYQRLSGGVSCLTLLVRREGGQDFILKQALSKLDVREDWYADPARIRTEAKAMLALQDITPAGSVPRLLFQDDDHHVIALEAVPAPHDNWKALLLSGNVRREHVGQFARILGSIHQASYQNPRFRAEFRDRQFFESLRLAPYYLFSAQEVPEAADFLQDLTGETWGIRLTLVHGDYSPKNILIHHGRLHLLDHEVMHFGDGAFDVGFSLTHLLSKARHVVPFRQVFLEAARYFWQTYRQHFPADPAWESRAVRHTIACLLARVKGKSPLEYLTEDEQRRQYRLCLHLLERPPATIPSLIEQISNAYDNEP